ncbi:MAG: urease accessory protein UreD [Nitrosospira sp.]|nr:urease accessory protein UreD [Nitrosospira sp.]
MRPTILTEKPAARQDSGVVVHRLYPAERSPHPAPGLPQARLEARLSLDFSNDSGTTRLVGREHFGPLIVQKPFYPDGRDLCQVVVIHPPGGVVGGDKLDIAVKVGASAKVQVTTPGAAKWYKANGHISQQAIRLDVGASGLLEWVPQETIFFDNAHVQIDHRVEMGKESSYIGCEILCFGRTASGESFTGGHIGQRTRIYRAGKPIWFEQLRLTGGGMGMTGSLGLGGNTVCATLVAVGKALPASTMDTVRESLGAIAAGRGHLGVSQFNSLVVMRYLGNSSETARRIMLHCWGLFRLEMLGRQAMVPRMWNT